DANGTVCVQMHGFSSRMLTQKVGACAARGEPVAPMVEAQVEQGVTVAAQMGQESLAEMTQEYLRKEFSGLLKLPAHKIDAQVGLEQYGIDSILAMQLTNQLEKTFGSLPKTLFFEYQTIRELTGYFIQQYPAQLAALFAPTGNQAIESVAAALPALPASSTGP